MADRELNVTSPCTQFVTCPDLKVDVRMANTSLSSFGPDVASQAEPLSVDWDPVVESSSNLHLNSNTAMLVDSGRQHFPLIGTGFNWTGGNLIIEVSWLRANPIGISPPVMLVEGLAYTATKWVQVTENFNPLHGNTYQDNPLTIDATTGTTNNRPVTWFYGDQSTSQAAISASGTPNVRFDPQDEHVVITRSAGDNTRWSIRCVDVTGRTLQQGVLGAASPGLRLSLEHAPAGVLMIAGTAPDGRTELFGRVVRP